MVVTPGSRLMAITLTLFFLVCAVGILNKGYDKKTCSSILTIDAIISVKTSGKDNHSKVIMSNGQELNQAITNVSVGDKYCEKYTLIKVVDGKDVVVSEISLKNKLKPIDI